MQTKCAFCDARIDPVPVDGTDPDDADEEWFETYECENGHVGTLHVTEATDANGWQRTEKTTGAIGEAAL